ncbi:MAG: hypothetical protein GY861_21785 [bacterium]|nr:hypothetical protein [bacterium]
MYCSYPNGSPWKHCFIFSRPKIEVSNGVIKIYWKRYLTILFEVWHRPVLRLFGYILHFSLFSLPLFFNVKREELNDLRVWRFLCFTFAYRRGNMFLRAFGLELS